MLIHTTMVRFLTMVLLLQVSLAWSLVVYHRSLRYTYPHKKNISLAGTLFQVDMGGANNNN